MYIKVYREVNTGGLDTITVSWEHRQRTWRTSDVSWVDFEIRNDQEYTFKCFDYSYHEEKRYRADKIVISRTWTFICMEGVFNMREVLT